MVVQQSPPDTTGVRAAQSEAEDGVFTAADTFGGVLRASPEFGGLLGASEALRGDPEANAAIAAFGQRRAELRIELLLGTLDGVAREELDRLEAAVLARPSVTAYVAAQNAFRATCVETAAVISGQIGIDFAANSRSGGCCG